MSERNEQCWIIHGQVDRQLWWGEFRWRSEGKPKSVGFDPAYVLKREEEMEAIILKNRELIVIDLKTGFKYVEVQHNTQALFYALGAWDRFALTHDIDTVRAMVYQPAHGGMHEWSLPVGSMS